jgi:putative hemolysin
MVVAQGAIQNEARKQLDSHYGQRSHKITVGRMSMAIFESFWFQALLIFGLILANGVFSMSELAVMTSRKVRLQQRAEDGDTAARTALELSNAPNRFLATVQIGITLIGTLSGALGGAALASQVASLLNRLFPGLAAYNFTIAFSLIVLLITYLSMVIGELVPKRMALSNPERVAAFVARPMNLLSRLADPVVRVLSLSTEFLLRLLGVKTSDEPSISDEEIRMLLQQGEQVGVFEEAETEIVSSVFRLGDRRVGSLMTPRPEVDWLDMNDPIEENLRYVIDSPHSFFPVADGDLDNTVGILRGKDLLARVAEAKTADLKDILMPAFFVPGSMPAFDLLEDLRQSGTKLALVIDEYGGLQGIVSLFDLLEAIVGFIPEAGESDQPLAVQRDDGSWLVDGTLNVGEFKALFDLDELPGEGRAGYQTVAGFVLAQIGSIPKAGMAFQWEKWKFEVVDMDGLRVDKVLVKEEG